MSKDYEIERKALQEAYETQKNEQEAELSRLQTAADTEKKALAAEREQGARRAYVREQKGLSSLAQKLEAEGKSGGESENGKVRIRRRYEQELADLGEKYADSVNEIDTQLREKNDKAAIQMRADEETYYTKLSRLAAEEQAAILAQQLADEQAAQKAAEKAAAAAEKAAEKAQKEAQKAAEKAQKEAEKAAAKAEKEAAKAKTQQEKDAAIEGKTLGGTANNLTQTTAETGARIQRLRVNDTAVLLVDGVRVANTTAYDGSGRMLITVGGEKMTPEEAESGVKNNELRYIILSNGRGYYEPVERTVSDKQEKTKVQRVLSGWTANNALMKAALEEATRTAK